MAMGPRDELRAADTDREAVAERLRGALEEGRLDLYEYDERLGQAYAAKTYGELDRLLADLPGAAPVAPEPVAAAADPVAAAGPVASGERARERQRRAAPRWLAELWRPWARAVSICTAIWAVTAVASVAASGGLPYFWPFWVAVPWGAVLLFVTVRGLSGEAAPERPPHGTRDGSRAALAGPDPVGAHSAGAHPAGGPVERAIPRRRGCC